MGVGRQADALPTYNFSHPPGRSVPDVDWALQNCDRELVERYMKYRGEVDTPGDELADFIIRDKKTGWALFDQACTRGIGSINEPPEALVNFFEREKVPDWVNFDQIERACNLMWRTPDVARTAFGMGSMVATYIIVPGTVALDAAGEQIRRAENRAVETATWAFNAMKPGALKPFGIGYQKTVRVRVIHAFARRQIARYNTWDSEFLGAPINQTMQGVAISFIFTLAMLDAARKFGIVYSRREIDDIFAYWRYLGYLQGTPEEILPKNVEEARALNKVMWCVEGYADDASNRLIRSFFEHTPKLDQAAIKNLPKYAQKSMTPEKFIGMKYAIFRYIWGNERADRYKLPDIKRDNALRIMACMNFLRDQYRKHFRPGSFSTEKTRAFLDSELQKQYQITGNSGAMLH